MTSALSGVGGFSSLLSADPIPVKWQLPIRGFAVLEAAWQGITDHA